MFVGTRVQYVMFRVGTCVQYVMFVGTCVQYVMFCVGTCVQNVMFVLVHVYSRRCLCWYMCTVRNICVGHVYSM